MKAITAPRILLRVLHHSGPDRIELDVFDTFQKIGVGLDEQAFKPSLPEMAAGFVFGMVKADIAEGDGLEDFGEGFILGGFHDQMDVVVHEAIGVEFEAVFLFKNFQAVKVDFEIVGMLKDGLSIISAVDDVIDETRNIDASRPGHRNGGEGDLLKGC